VEADQILVNLAEEKVSLDGIDGAHAVLVLGEGLTAEEDFGVVFTLDELAVLQELVEALTGFG
jgi:hypothetical protein